MAEAFVATRNINASLCANVGVVGALVYIRASFAVSGQIHPIARSAGARVSGGRSRTKPRRAARIRAWRARFEQVLRTVGQIGRLVRAADAIPDAVAKL